MPVIGSAVYFLRLIWFAMRDSLPMITRPIWVRIIGTVSVGAGFVFWLPYWTDFMVWLTDTVFAYLDTVKIAGMTLRDLRREVFDFIAPGVYTLHCVIDLDPILSAITFAVSFYVSTVFVAWILGFLTNFNFAGFGSSA